MCPRSLLASRFWRWHQGDGLLTTAQIEKAMIVGVKIKEALARSHKAGVTIAFGTDMGVGPHGQNAREFGFMVEAGMRSREAIKAATVNPAVAIAYRRRLEAALQADSIVATWAGGDLAEQGSQHFSSVAVGPLLVELIQSPQYSVSNMQMPWSNHLHVMLRDLQSPVWADPLGYHEQHDRA
jgi:hypothetical protein